MNEACEHLKERNKMLKEYEDYQWKCYDKHEDHLSFKRWLKEVYNPPKGCTKCQRIKKTLLQKLK